MVLYICDYLFVFLFWYSNAIIIAFYFILIRNRKTKHTQNCFKVQFLCGNGLHYYAKYNKNKNTYNKKIFAPPNHTHTWLTIFNVPCCVCDRFSLPSNSCKICNMSIKLRKNHVWDSKTMRVTSILLPKFMHFAATKMV